MQSQFKGKIEEITPVILVGRYGNIEKRVLCLVEDNPTNEYPNKIAIDFTKEKVFLLDDFNVGDIVNVMCNLSYNKKEETNSIFNSIRGWKIEMVKSVGEQKEAEKKKIEDDDLPF